MGGEKSLSGELRFCEEKKESEGFLTVTIQARKSVNSTHVQDQYRGPLIPASEGGRCARGGFVPYASVGLLLGSVLPERAAPFRQRGNSQAPNPFLFFLGAWGLDLVKRVFVLPFWGNI